MAATEYAKTLDGATIEKVALKDAPKTKAASDGGPVWRPIVNEPKPAFDPLTHTCVRSQTITPDQVTKGWTVSEKPLTEVKAALVEAINGEAYARIIAIAPEHKQRNALARAVELIGIQSGTWMESKGNKPAGRVLTAEENTEAQALSQIWEDVNAIRAASNAANAAINAAADVAGAKAAYDAVAWP